MLDQLQRSLDECNTQRDADEEPKKRKAKCANEDVVAKPYVPEKPKKKGMEVHQGILVLEHPKKVENENEPENVEQLQTPERNNQEHKKKKKKNEEKARTPQIPPGHSNYGKEQDGKGKSPSKPACEKLKPDKKKGAQKTPQKEVPKPGSKTPQKRKH
ncbi:hypothetical protein RB195_005680 [Necator americanus]